MPFPNEHAARQADPGAFDEFRRENDPKGFPDGISLIFGIKVTPAGRTSAIQSIRFDKDKFTPAEAKKWLKDHDFKTVLEEATEPKKIVKSFWHGVV